MNRLPGHLRPAMVTVELPATEDADAAGRELARHAGTDPQECWGYFPSLTGWPGIHTDLPACRHLASTFPAITTGGTRHQFSFLRLSLRCQSTQAAYHLDTDAATALTGDPATLDRRLVGRILLNLSTTQERHLYYLDLDTAMAALIWEGSYVRLADRALAQRHAACATIPPRSGAVAYGISFLANHVLHSGVDGPNGHFVAAYGYDRDIKSSQPAGRAPSGQLARDWSALAGK